MQTTCGVSSSCVLFYIRCLCHRMAEWKKKAAKPRLFTFAFDSILWCTSESVYNGNKIAANDNRIRLDWVNFDRELKKCSFIIDELPPVGCFYFVLNKWKKKDYRLLIFHRILTALFFRRMHKICLLVPAYRIVNHILLSSKLMQATKIISFISILCVHHK